MANVSLSSGELKKALLFVSVSTVVIGLSVGFLRLAWSGTGEAEEERVVNALVALIFGLVSGASWAVIFSIWVFRLTWTWGWLAWLTGRPIIHGVWFGHLDTSYESSDASVGKRIPIAFVIKQTFLNYSLLSYTERQDSVTLAETLDVDDKHHTVQLRYMYRFQIMRANERKLTTGAGELKLVEGGKRLKGNYLTDSPTHGSINLVFVQRDVDGIDTFKAVQQLYEAQSAPPTSTTSALQS